MVYGKDCRALNKASLFVVALIDLKMERMTKASMIIVHMCYGQIVADVIGCIRLRARSKIQLDRLERRAKKLENCL